MKQTKRTPSTLDEAIQDAICNGPMSQIQEHAYLTLRDFMAQKFNVAYFTASDETLAVLEKLFSELTKRSK